MCEYPPCIMPVVSPYSFVGSALQSLTTPQCSHVYRAPVMMFLGHHMTTPARTIAR